MLGNIGETFELLFDKNNNVAYKAFQELQKESEETDCVYPFIDRLSDMLDSDNSYIRTRGLTLLAYNAKWDGYGIILLTMSIILQGIAPITRFLKM